MIISREIISSLQLPITFASPLQFKNLKWQSMWFALANRRRNIYVRTFVIWCSRYGHKPLVLMGIKFPPWVPRSNVGKCIFTLEMNYMFVRAPNFLKASKVVLWKVWQGYHSYIVVIWPMSNVIPSCHQYQGSTPLVHSLDDIQYKKWGGMSDQTWISERLWG